MHISALRRIGIASVLVIVSALLFSLAARDSAPTSAFHTPNVPSFSGTFDVRLCNTLPAIFNASPPGVPAYLNGGGPTCAPTTAPSGNPGLGTVFTLAAGGHNFAPDFFASYTRDLTLASHAPGNIPYGTIVGGLRSTATLGLLTGTCGNTVFPKFVFFNAENAYAAGTYTTQWPVSIEGTPDRFKTTVEDAGLNDDDQLVTGAAGSDGLADPNAQGVLKVPDTVVRFLDPDGDGLNTDGNAATLGDQPVPYLARYFASTQVAAQWQMLNLMVFAPGVLKAAFSGNSGTTLHPLAALDSGLGNVTITILNDPTAAAVSISPISDFCSPLGTEAGLLGMVDADGNGTVETARITSPVGTSHLAGIQTISLRDNDNDGLENALDSCPAVANTEDPYTDDGPDDDMLDSACDPTPAVDTNIGDHDNDGYKNNQDICPLVDPAPVGPGGNEAENESNVTRNSASPDGGPQTDNIGDGCDASISVANGGWFKEVYTDSVCITSGANVDVDGDGFCTDGGAIAIGEDPNDANAAIPTSNTSRRIPDATDPDVDTYSSNNEVKYGTDPMQDCALISGHDAWPRDFDTNRVVNITDLVQLLPPFFGSSAGSASFTMRRNLDTSNNVINITDLVSLLPPFFGTSCTP